MPFSKKGCHIKNCTLVIQNHCTKALVKEIVNFSTCPGTSKSQNVFVHRKFYMSERTNLLIPYRALTIYSFKISMKPDIYQLL